MCVRARVQISELKHVLEVCGFHFDMHLACLEAFERFHLGSIFRVDSINYCTQQNSVALQINLLMSEIVR